MLAEIFMLRLEANARTSKETITRSASQFVPIIFPAIGSTQVLSTPVIGVWHEQSVWHPLLKIPDDRCLASRD